MLFVTLAQIESRDADTAATARLHRSEQRAESHERVVLRLPDDAAAAAPPNAALSGDCQAAAGDAAAAEPRHPRGRTAGATPAPADGLRKPPAPVSLRGGTGPPGRRSVVRAKQQHIRQHQRISQQPAARRLHVEG